MNKVYIESTIPSYYVARPSGNLIQAARQAMTRKWWDQGCSGLEAFTSQETLDEIARGDQKMAMHGIDFLVTWNCRHIANPYAQNRLRKVAGDSGFVLPVICTPEEFLNDENY